MCCSTQALHSELIGRKLDVNQMCLSLAVKPRAMEVQSNIETAAGQRLLLSVLRPPRGTFNFLEVSLSWHRNSKLCFIKQSAYVVDNKAQIIWSWENWIINAWAHTEICLDDDV